MEKILGYILKKEVMRVIAYGVLVFVLLFLGVSVASTLFDIPGGIRIYTVQTGSMAPRMPAGSVIFTKPQREYREGDVITFTSETEREAERPIQTVTHRIVGVSETDEDVLYQTKGDNNPTPDGILVDKELVIGKVMISIPYLGYPVAFAKTEVGFILLIVIPATIIIYSELLVVKEEVKKHLVKRKEKKNDLKTKKTEEHNSLH